MTVDRKATISFSLNAASPLIEDATASTLAVAEGSVRLVNVDSGVNGTTVPVVEYDLVSSNNKDYEIQFLGANDLDPNTRYKLEINPTGTDNTETVNFTTGLAATDDVAPTVAEQGTVANTTTTSSQSVSVTAVAQRGQITFNTDSIAVQMSEGLDISDATVTLRNLSDNTTVSLPGSSVFLADSDADSTNGEDILVVDPAVNLDADSTYVLNVSDVKDASGNVASDFEFIFESAAAPATVTNSGVLASVSNSVQGDAEDFENANADITNGSIATDTITVNTVNPSTTMNVQVDNGDTADQVATKIQAALTGNVTGYNVAVNGVNTSQLDFTATSAGNLTDITFSIAEQDYALENTGTISGAVTTQGDDAGNAEEFTITVSDDAAAAGKASITVGAETYIIDIAVTDTAADIADKIEAAINTDGVPTGYSVDSVTGNSSVVLTYANDSGQTDLTLTASQVDTTVAAAAATVSQQGAANTTETHTATFTNSLATKDITVTVNGQAYTVGVVNGMSSTQVATAVANEIGSTDPNWTVTNNFNGTLTFTSKIANANVSDLTVNVTE
ncbi:Ig-like domain [Gracilibacillus boraciitolerans JCM 21714]|uniref:Ig-like domain n=1 Tax=Gracilibacillus boraciitolerans JCM 21714 TaxID=1298598 RepID=W4VGX0_9BACI|nr:hypothetical protein [Gracilibacillus boraciitolerans]GAE92442.1 Ig-like domain [Gracilibacillus boraciitolerans JCM 21714]